MSRIGAGYVGSSMRSLKPRIVEGYLYVYPYAGDNVFIHPEKIDVRSFKELSRAHWEAWEGRGISLLDILCQLEGRRVRVVIEERRVSIEVLG